MIDSRGLTGAVYSCFCLLHIVAGFVGMYGGLVPLFTAKGGRAHRKWGQVFTVAMGIAAVTAFPLAWLRTDLFQAAVGVLSGYLTFFGYRVLRRHSSGSLRTVDWAGAVVGAVCFGAMAATGGYLLLLRPGAEARAAFCLGLVGLLVAGRDLEGLIKGDTSFSRRILDHLIASSLALVTAFSAFLNTQFYRLTHVDWPLDQKMLLPFAVALPLLACGTLIWAHRLRQYPSLGALRRASGDEGSELERMRALGIAEGISFILLLGVGVPLKHLGGHGEFVRLMGPVHGALFVLYSVSVLVAGRTLRWPLRRVALALAAGVVPFGALFLDKRSQEAGAPSRT